MREHRAVRPLVHKHSAVGDRLAVPQNGTVGGVEPLFAESAAAGMWFAASSDQYASRVPAKPGLALVRERQSSTGWAGYTAG